jgi:hypothetical protein
MKVYMDGGSSPPSSTKRCTNGAVLEIDSRLVGNEEYSKPINGENQFNSVYAPYYNMAA